MKRADLLKLLDAEEWKDSFQEQLDDKITGWIVLWNGKMVKPKSGNSYYYASEKAALQGLERNINFHTSVTNRICFKLHGFIYYETAKQPNRTDGDFKFLGGRYNDSWKKYYMQEEYYAHGKLDYREREKIEKENSPEYQLMKSRRDEWRMIETFCHNAIKSVLIPAWIKEGILEIKEV